MAAGPRPACWNWRSALQRVMGSDSPPEFGPARGVNGVTRRLADVSMPPACIGWKAEIGLDEGLRRLVSWWQSRAGDLPVKQVLDDPGHAALARRGGGGRRRRSRHVGLGGPGAAGGRVRAGLRRTIGDRHAVAVSSCTAALHLALLVAGIGPGMRSSSRHCRSSRPPTPSGTWARSLFSRTWMRRRRTWSRETVQPCLTERTPRRHRGGPGRRARRPGRLRALCEPRGVTVIEDAACAAGPVIRAARLAPGLPSASVFLPPAQAAHHRRGRDWSHTSDAVAARLRRLREHGMDVSAADRHVSRQPVIEHYLKSDLTTG